MNYLFIHNNYPAQFRSLVEHLAKQPGNQVFFLSEFKRNDVNIPGVQQGIVPVPDAPGGTRGTDIPLIKTQRRAESFALAMLELKAKGFYPDIIYYHGGWGGSLFSGDVFPQARRVNFAEWFFNSHYPYEMNQDDAASQQSISLLAGGYATNHMHLESLALSDLTITPTEWQKSVQPKVFHNSIKVQHEGVDTDFYIPAQEKRSLALQELGLKIPVSAQIVTYASRGFEPMRGFPAFMQSLPLLLDAAPEAHIAIMGDDHVVYDQPRADRRGWLQVLMEQTSLDFSRLHILPASGLIQYRRLLQISDLHVYLTRPYVLSWSLLEAMSSGALVLAANTEPLQEIAEPGVNMFTIPANASTLATPIADPSLLAEQAAALLKQGQATRPVREAARQTVLDKYSLKGNLPKLLKLLHG